MPTPNFLALLKDNNGNIATRKDNVLESVGIDHASVEGSVESGVDYEAEDNGESDNCEENDLRTTIAQVPSPVHDSVQSDAVVLNFQGVEGDWNSQSGVSKEHFGHDHNVLDKMTQGISEGKIKVKASQVQDSVTWASVVATNGNSRPSVRGLRLNHRSSSGSNLKYVVPKFHGVIDIEDDLINE
ncbi:hypothetical protein U1Q18_032754 [Sarracenia purpurea var. burkii]